MHASKTFSVVPALPERLSALREIAFNMWWCWNHDAIDLFRRLDQDLWEEANHNPVKLLGMISQKRLEEAANDDSFLAHLDRVDVDMQVYFHLKTWFEREHAEVKDAVIAYFSAEFGISEAIPIYSGGLGLLAGDHLKSASDLGIPLTAVGLLYQEGYFRQYLNVDGWQQETYPRNDFFTMPVLLEREEGGNPLVVQVTLPGRDVYAQVWKLQVGRVNLYLLDTNIEQNNLADRQITAQLYGGDMEMRIKQEILLGIGGMRALRALGLNPLVCHMNEGHSAFLTLERIRQVMEEQHMTYAEAYEFVSATNVFTTHTPVPAGNDVFPPDILQPYMMPYIQQIGLSWDDFMALGRQNPADASEGFCMTVLALKTAKHCNGVSQLHGHVSRRMWNKTWPNLPEDDVPIGAITNGVHAKSWISNDLSELLERYIGPRWKENPEDQNIWKRVYRIPDSELWRTHERRRERLVSYARRRLVEQLRRRGASRRDVQMAMNVLNPEALTIGFARRFATYKRATLLLRDRERLMKLLLNREQPIQFIFAGKAHPRDDAGKQFIREIVHFAGQPDVRGKVIFLEDYDIAMARYLVGGCDVWLNNPRRPLEASGTSGMKAAMNGCLNLSVLDGWWVEGYSPELGWSIGNGEEYQDTEYQDTIESRALYERLENEIIPLFYDRGPDDLPSEWIKMMKASMARLSAFFNTNRMLMEYTNRFYVPAGVWAKAMLRGDLKDVRKLAAWRNRVRQAWPQVHIEEVQAEREHELKVGERVAVTAWVALGNLETDDVVVELYTGRVDASGEIIEAESIPMRATGETRGSTHRFEGHIPCAESGRFGYAVRVLPRYEFEHHKFDPGLIAWG